ncbi:hypothetical protein [Prochlorococcus marinus]|nr:hypothetical protein [Prochlorococcus marinus]
MTPRIISIMTLGIAISGLSVWWVRITLKEGNKALQESKKKNLDN